MAKKGLLFIVTGPSGVGKKTILDKLINKEELNLKYSISLTTRKPRINEVNGIDYFFVDENEFDQRAKNGEFIEWAEFAGNKYGTLKSQVYEFIENGKNVILEIEVQGGQNIISQFSNDEYISIFITPPSIQELENRLVKRGTESLEKIKFRLEKAEGELKFAELYNEIVLNDDIESAAKKVEDIMKKYINREEQGQ